MAYTTTTKLNLEKATPGTNQPFETASINANWDKVDANAVSDHNRITAVETTIASGTVNAANTATTATTATSATSATTATTAAKASKLTASGLDRTLFIQSTAPTSGMVTGDIWIQV